MTSLSCSSPLPCSWDEDKIDHCHLQGLNYPNPASLSSLSLYPSPLTQHDLLPVPDDAKGGCTSANTSGTWKNKGDIGLGAPEEESLTGAYGSRKGSEYQGFQPLFRAVGILEGFGVGKKS